MENQEKVVRIGEKVSNAIVEMAQLIENAMAEIRNQVEESVSVIRGESQKLRLAHGDMLMIQNTMTAYGSALVDGADELDETIYTVGEILDFVDTFDGEEEDEDWVEEEDEEVPCDCVDCDEDCDCECHNED